MSGLSTFGIARKNIQRQPGRSFCLILAILLFSFFVFVGSVFSISLSNGAESFANRLGADVMIVPAGYDPHIDNILLSGKPSTFRLPDGVIERLKNFDGIAQISPQIFLASLNASCCSVPVQLMGIDYDTDFIVKSWLKSALPLNRDLIDGEVIIGSRISGNIGDILMFFGRQLKIAGRLEQTGMGFDQTIFMNRPTAALLKNDRDTIMGNSSSKDDNFISTVMLKLEPGFDSAVIAREINRQLNSEGIFALFSKKLVNNISGSLIIISKIVRASLSLIWLLAIVIVALIFSLTLSERKKEMGVLRALGASRKKLISLCLAEVFIISSYGAVFGVILGAVLIAAVSPLAGSALNLPFLLPSWKVLSFLFLASAGAAILTGIFAAAWSAIRASRVDVHEIMRGA